MKKDRSNISLETKFDPWSLVEELRLSPHMVSEQSALASMQASLSRFEQIGNAFLEIDQNVTDAFIFSFRFGVVIGAYLQWRDPKTLEEADRFLQTAHQSARGKASREGHGAKTRAHVKALALNVVSNEKIGSLADLSKKVLDCWGAGPPSLKTIVRHLSQLQEAGELPAIKRGRRRKIS